MSDSSKASDSTPHDSQISTESMNKSTSRSLPTVQIEKSMQQPKPSDSFPHKCHIDHRPAKRKYNEGIQHSPSLTLIFSMTDHIRARWSTSWARQTAKVDQNVCQVSLMS